MAYQEVCKQSELSKGQKKGFKLGDAYVIVYHLEDGFYATQAKCTHLFKSMENGKLIEGTQIQCPLHRACFDIRSGEVIRWANFPPGVQLLNVVRAEKSLKTYPVKVENGSVLIEL